MKMVQLETEDIVNLIIGHLNRMQNIFCIHVFFTFFAYISRDSKKKLSTKKNPEKVGINISFKYVYMFIINLSTFSS